MPWDRFNPCATVDSRESRAGRKRPDRPAEASEDARSAGVESDREAQQVRTHQGSQDFTSLIAGLEGIAEREADDCDTAAKDAVMLRQEPGIAIVQLDTVIRPDQAGRKEQRQHAERLYHATCR